MCRRAGTCRSTTTSTSRTRSRSPAPRAAPKWWDSSASRPSAAARRGRTADVLHRARHGRDRHLLQQGHLRQGGRRSRRRTGRSSSSIQQKLRDAGYIPFLVMGPALTDWGLDLIFDQLYYDIIYGLDVKKDSPERAAFLKHYLDWDEIVFLYRKGFFTRRDPRFPRGLAHSQGMAPVHAQESCLNDAILHGHHPLLHAQGGGDAVGRQLERADASPRTPRWISGGACSTCRPSPRATSPFAPEQPHPQCYIGEAGNQFSITAMAMQDTGSSATSERLQRAVAFLQFLTTPEETSSVVNECLAFMPNIVGVPTHPELQAVRGQPQPRVHEREVVFHLRPALQRDPHADAHALSERRHDRGRVHRLVGEEHGCGMRQHRDAQEDRRDAVREALARAGTVASAGRRGCPMAFVRTGRSAFPAGVLCHAPAHLPAGRGVLLRAVRLGVREFAVRFRDRRRAHLHRPGQLRRVSARPHPRPQLRQHVLPHGVRRGGEHPLSLPDRPHDLRPALRARPLPLPRAVPRAHRGAGRRHADDLGRADLRRRGAAQRVAQGRSAWGHGPRAGCRTRAPCCGRWRSSASRSRAASTSSSSTPGSPASPTACTRRHSSTAPPACASSCWSTCRSS